MAQAPQAAPAPERFYGILFPGPSPAGCLCILPQLGEGQDSVAQVVEDRASHEMIVRKFRRRLYGELDKESRTEREVRICSYLEQQFRAQPGPRPLFAELRGNQDLRPAGERGYTRVSFWRWYNVGDVETLWELYDIVEPPAPPAAFMARYIWQVLTTLEAMGRLDPDVAHRDLHEGNVFVHWPDYSDSPDFIIGDFGKARRADEAPEPTMDEYHGMTPRARALYSTPFMGSSPVTMDVRPPWDVTRFAESLRDEENKREASLETRYADPGFPDVLADLLDALDALGAQDEDDRVLPEDQRPPRQSLAQVIQQAKDAEAALRQDQGEPDPNTNREIWEVHLAERGQFTYRTYASEYEAHEDVHRMGLLPPYRIVDLQDEADIDAKAQDMLSEQRPPGNVDNDDDIVMLNSGSGGVGDGGQGSSGGGIRDLPAWVPPEFATPFRNRVLNIALEFPPSSPFTPNTPADCRVHISHFDPSPGPPPGPPPPPAP